MEHVNRVQKDRRYEVATTDCVKEQTQLDIQEGLKDENTFIDSPWMWQFFKLKPLFKSVLKRFC